jgi:large subunit ribosomal protein L22
VHFVVACGTEKRRKFFTKEMNRFFAGLRYNSNASSLFQKVVEEAKQIKREVKLPIFSTPNFGSSYKKVNHLTRLIQNMSLKDAKIQMDFNLRKPAVYISKMLHRVMANLRHNYQLDPADYYLRRVWVGKGVYRKRINYHGRGRFGVMHNPRAHVKIELGKRLPNPTREEKDFDKLCWSFKKRALFVQIKDSKGVRVTQPVWSKKPWKYVRSPKWTTPDNALRSDLEEK